MADTGILAMLAKPSKKSALGDKSGASSDGGEEDQVASSLRDMFDALKEGRDKEAATAFRAAYEHCLSGGEPDADDTGDDDKYDDM